MTKMATEYEIMMNCRLCTENQIFNNSKVRIPEWAGHINDGRTISKVFMRKPAGKRKAGRPKLRWLDRTENDLKSMRVRRWRKKS